MSKTIKTRIQNKHDIPANWEKASFVPLAGELIIYDDHYFDEEGNKIVVADTIKYKFGDGVTAIDDLPFVVDYDDKIAELEGKISTLIFQPVFECATLKIDRVAGATKIEWGDGSVTRDIKYPASVMHTYTNPGTYICKIYNATEFATSSTYITSINLGDCVTNIPAEAFRGCDTLKQISIPSNVTTIGDNAFYYCSSLTSIQIPDSVTSIGSDAFEGCSSLTSVEIGDSVTTIGDSAFVNCKSLTGIIFKNKVPVELNVNVANFYKGCFYGCSNLNKIYVPYGCGSTYTRAWALDGVDGSILNLITEYDRPANMSDLSQVAKSGNFNDLTINWDTMLIFDGGVADVQLAVLDETILL